MNKSKQKHCVHVRQDQTDNFIPLCKNYNDIVPGCLGQADNRYTMDFTDVGGSKIFWCSNCGPIAHAMEKALLKAIEERGPEFTEALECAIERAEKGDA